MTPPEVQPAGPAPAATPPPGAGEALVQARCGELGLLVPLAAVARVLPAGLPAARPAAAAGGPPVISVGGRLLPVLFGEVLLGAAEALLRPQDQLLVLQAGARQALLWVSAVEDLRPCQPAAAPPGAAADLVAAWSGGDEPLAVLDVPRAVALALGDPEEA